MKIDKNGKYCFRAGVEGQKDLRGMGWGAAYSKPCLSEIVSLLQSRIILFIQWSKNEIEKVMATIVMQRATRWVIKGGRKRFVTLASRFGGRVCPEGKGEALLPGCSPLPPSPPCAGVLRGARTDDLDLFSSALPLQSEKASGNIRAWKNNYFTVLWGNALFAYRYTITRKPLKTAVETCQANYTCPKVREECEHIWAQMTLKCSPIQPIIGNKPENASCCQTSPLHRWGGPAECSMQLHGSVIIFFLCSASVYVCVWVCVCVHAI